MDEIDFMPTPKPASRRKMNIFYLIDTSFSMEGGKIESVNQAMPEVVDIVGEISDKNNDNAEIFVSCMLFSSGAKWVNDEALPAKEYIWNPVGVSGCTDLGDACRLLEKALHREGNEAQLTSTSGHKNPAIILLSDGEPTDDYLSGIEELKKNRWFRAATKVAIAIGNDANIDKLAEFTGNKELVIKVHNVEALKKMIKVVSATVSKIGSQSAQAGGEKDTSIDEIVVETVDKEVKNTDGAEIPVDIPGNSAPTDDDWD